MKHLTATTHYFFAIAVSVVLFAAGLLAQVPPTPAPLPTRGPAVTPKVKMKTPKMPMPGEFPPGVEMGEGTTTERAIAVDPKVSVQLCVTQGTVHVNGWGRNEVRAFVSDGSKFAFRVLEKSPKDPASPVLISLVGLKQLPGGQVTSIDCIAGDDVELDIPENATLSLKGRETDTSIDSVRKVWVNNVGGDMIIRNVSQGVRASTYQGDVTVENSAGPMVLESSSGNVVVYGAWPSEVGDAFRAKTNSGSISLQKIGYRLTDVNSLSGTVYFAGELLSGASFSFTTTNGAIRLAIPQQTSCKIAATYGFGNFSSDLPMKNLTDDVHPGPVKSVNSIMGSGDATLKLSTSSGSIQIKKLEP